MDAEWRIVYGDEAGLERARQGFNRGFRDYKYGTQFDLAGMRQYLARAGIDLADCAVLLVAEEGGWQGGGIALLAVEGEEAWCGGLAVDPAYRGQGRGKALMQAVQRRGRARGVSLLRLEVLANNRPARALYRQLGYEEVRELLIWERASRQGALPVPFARLQEIDPAQVLGDLHGWHELRPTWQRRADFLRRSLSLLQAYMLPAQDGLPIAYVLCHHTPHGRTGRETLHIFDIAVDPAADVADAGRPLLQALQLRYLDADLVLVNEPADSKLNRIFAALGFLVIDRQYELLLRLDEEAGTG